MRRSLTLFLVLTGIHSVVTLGCGMYAMAASSAAFDNPALPRAYSASVAHGATNVLLLPARLVWTSWASQSLSNIVEWLVFIANSMIWAGVAVWVIARYSRRR